MSWWLSFQSMCRMAWWYLIWLKVEWTKHIITNSGEIWRHLRQIIPQSIYEWMRLLPYSKHYFLYWNKLYVYSFFIYFVNICISRFKNDAGNFSALCCCKFGNFANLSRKQIVCHWYVNYHNSITQYIILYFDHIGWTIDTFLYMEWSGLFMTRSMITVYYIRHCSCYNSKT